MKTENHIILVETTVVLSICDTVYYDIKKELFSCTGSNKTVSYGDKMVFY